MTDANREGLRAAADVLKQVMKRVAGVKTNETARMVQTYFSSVREAVVSAGFPVGPWGWNPIQALMFDDNKRHPLFGNTRHWYSQGYYAITETTVRLGADDAAAAYADTALPILFEEHGFE